MNLYYEILDLAVPAMHLLILSGMVVLAVVAVRMRDLLSAVLALAGMELLLAMEFFLLHAPDVAIAQAGVGAALTTAIYVIALRATRRVEEVVS